MSSIRIIIKQTRIAAGKGVFVKNTTSRLGFVMQISGENLDIKVGDDGKTYLTYDPEDAVLKYNQSGYPVLYINTKK